MSADTRSSILNRLPWFVELVDYLKTHEDDLWGWFSTEVDQEKQAEAVRLEVLRTTYRIERESQVELYETADAVAATLGVDAPLTIYQAQQAPELNAALKFVPGEVHIVLHGPLLEILDASELTALFGHELSHYVLWTEWDEEILIAHEILLGMLNDPRGDEVHTETYRRLRLFSEVFCDRGSHIACGNLEAAVSALVKMHTGLKEVDAAGYLRQAEEAVSGSTDNTEADEDFVTEGFSHPEAFLRVRALHLWSAAAQSAASEDTSPKDDGPRGHSDEPSDATGAERTIRRMIEGPLSLQQIDLPGQRHLTAVTRHVIAEIVQPAWMRTELVMSHARLFFPDIERGAEVGGAESVGGPVRDITSIVSEGDETLARYVGSLLLDFVTADRDIQEAALAAAIQQADVWGIGDQFAEFAMKELKLRKKQFQQIRSNAESLIAEASTP